MHARPIETRGPWPNWTRRQLVWFAWLAVVTAAGPACRDLPRKDLVVGQAYVPSNFHRQSPHLPEDCRRVAVLPLTSDASQPDATAAR